jgi:hypothetical protein
MAWWHESDIAAWISTHDTPVLDTYTAGGIGERTSTRIVVRAKDACLSQLAQYRVGGIAKLRQIYPDDVF